MGSKFWYIPFSVLFMNFFVVVMNAVNISKGNPIISFDYSAIVVFASLVIAVVLEFVYLFVEKMVME